MAEKRFLSWLGFNSDSLTKLDAAQSTNSDSLTQSGASPDSSRAAQATTGTGKESSATQSVSSVARIRELEAQLADLRSRRDLTSLTKE